MMLLPKYPSLYQVNTRVWLTELSQKLGKRATLDDIPEEDLDRFRELGLDWIWMLSVWKTSELSRKVSRENREWRVSFEKTLDDLKEEDIGGSGFAIAEYTVNPKIGGEAALKRFRKRLGERGIRLMLDFVPNHMGLDHPWVNEHRDYFIEGGPGDDKNNPIFYTRVDISGGSAVMAYGRDPYFPGWPDTLQLDYSNPDTVAAMAGVLAEISKKCDGVRCDMAMLILPDVFTRTWGREARSFWPETIKSIREKHPDFYFMAEVYWDLEWTMQQLGFNYAYDKRLYDRLLEGHARPVREHFLAGLDYQEKLARFLENHDEPRAAKEFSLHQHAAAAIITYLSPGLRFFHQGQFEGRTRHISPHLVRAPKEPVNEDIRKFYRAFLEVLQQPVFREGDWSLLRNVPAWEGNGSHYDFVGFCWEKTGQNTVLVVVNFSDHYSQCYIYVPLPDHKGDTTVRFKDLLGPALYDRNAGELSTRGLYLDMPGWAFHVFEISYI